MIPRTSSGDTFKTRGGGSSSASRLRDKRSSRVAVAIAAMLSLVFTTFAGTATAFASPEDPGVEGLEEGFNLNVDGDPRAESDVPEDAGDNDAPPAGDLDADSGGSSQGDPAAQVARSAKDEGDFADISPLAEGDLYYPSDAPGVIYSSTAAGVVEKITYNSTTNTYTREAFGSKATGVSSFNGLGISPGVGREMYAYERSGSNPAVSSATVYAFNQVTGEWDNTNVTANSKSPGMGGGIQFIAGAVDPQGSFYMGGYTWYGDGHRDNGDRFRLYEYVPANDEVSGSAIYVGYIDTSSISGGTNGDMDFDREGNLYITRCCGLGTTVISVTAATLEGASGGQEIDATIGKTVGSQNVGAVAGVAFDSTGHMFLGSADSLQVYDMPSISNGKVVPQQIGRAHV